MTTTGLCKVISFQKIRDNYGSGMVSALTQKKIGKSFQNCCIVVLIFWGYCTMCVLFVKVISHFDLSVLSMSMMGFQKKNTVSSYLTVTETYQPRQDKDGGWGGLNSIQFFQFLTKQTLK